jgi:hypothetical protein
MYVDRYVCRRPVTYDRIGADAAARMADIFSNARAERGRTECVASVSGRDPPRRYCNRRRACPQSLPVWLRRAVFRCMGGRRGDRETKCGARSNEGMSRPHGIPWKVVLQVLFSLMHSGTVIATISTTTRIHHAQHFFL